MKRLILLDLNNFGFAAMANPPLHAGGRETQAILGVLKRVHGIFANHPEAMIMLLDDGRSWRHDIYSDYKGNRGKDPKQAAVIDSYKAQKEDIVKGLQLLGVTYVQAANLEADDLAEILTRNAISKLIPVTLMTADHDWRQLVQRGVNWVNVIHNQSVRHASFKRDTGYDTPAQFVDAKCVLGDNGDNIKGIHKVGPKTLEALYKYYDTFDKFLDFVEGKWGITGATDHWLQHEKKIMPKALREIDVEAARATMTRNRLLMDLATPSRPQPVGMKKTRYPLNREGFERFCHRNAFRSILTQLDEFIKPFEENINVIRQAS